MAKRKTDIALGYQRRPVVGDQRILDLEQASFLNEPHKQTDLYLVSRCLEIDHGMNR
jgi:hypothetical protein